MKRVDNILRHPIFCDAVNKTNNLEKNRQYCRHNMGHFLDTARIAYILNIETGAGINKECLYAAALLHDIGRFRQYKDKTPHEIESARLASLILPECCFNSKETEAIISAIASHRDEHKIKDKMGEMIYRADKLSRRCADCQAHMECDWPDERKNFGLEY